MPSNLSEYLISTLDSEQMEGEGQGAERGRDRARRTKGVGSFKPDL